MPTELEEIEQVIADSPDEYFKNPVMVERYSELLEAEEKGVPAPPGNVTAQRKQEIEEMMAAPMNSSPYWENSPRGEALRQEYSNILNGWQVVKVADEPYAQPDTVEAIEAAAERWETAFQGLDTVELDLAYDGLPPATREAIADVVIDPSSFLDVVSRLGDNEFDELNHFVESMTEEEWQAAKRALLVD